jgi:mono/diheme cytochrome c family protein
VLPVQGHVSSPQAFNPDTGLFYVAVRNSPFGFVAEEGAKMGNQLLSINTGRQPEVPRPQVTGDAAWLSAWNPVTQKEAWRAPGGSGTMTTATNLVFQTEGTNLVAYRADNGEKLWEGPLGVRAGPGIISYAIDDEQYIATVASGRVVVFKLGGNAELPAAAVTAQPVLNPPARFGTEAQIAMGQEMYLSSCSACHEGQARNSTGAPDLSYSVFLGSNAAFSSVVIDGILMDGGMRSFRGGLSPEQVEAIRAHLVTVANDLKDNPPPARGFGGPGGRGGGAGGRGGGPPGGARAGGPGGAPAQPAAPTEAPVGLHQSQ